MRVHVPPAPPSLLGSLEKAAEDAAHVRDPDEALGPQLQPGPALVNYDHLGSTPVDGKSLSASFSFYFY